MRMALETGGPPPTSRGAKGVERLAKLAILAIALAASLVSAGCHHRGVAQGPLSVTRIPEKHELTTDEIVARALPYVVRVDAGDRQGSGFFVTDSLVVTCFHVVRGREQIRVHAAFWEGEALGVAGWSETDDVAVLQVTARPSRGGLPVAVVVPPIGSHILAISSPLGLENTVSDGVFSALRPNPDRLQFTAPVSPGSSGAPLFDSHGDVIGIVSDVLTTLAGGRTYGQNLNFAVPAASIWELMRSPRTTNMAQFAELTEPEEEKQWRATDAALPADEGRAKVELGERLGAFYASQLRAAVTSRNVDQLRVLFERHKTLVRDRQEIRKASASLFAGGAQGLSVARELLAAWDEAMIEANPQNNARLQAAKQAASDLSTTLEAEANRAQFPKGFGGFPFLGDEREILRACAGEDVRPGSGIDWQFCPRMLIPPPWVTGGASLSFLNGQLVSVNADVASYQGAVSAITEKYGPPSSFGRHYGKEWVPATRPSFAANTVFEWHLRGGRIRVGKATGKPFIAFIHSARDSAVDASY